MNNRDYKQFVAGNYYHVFNRAIGGQELFKSPEDYHFFLARLAENLGRGEPSSNLGKYQRDRLPAGLFGILSYCLMPNHFHFLIEQKKDVPITKLILKVCTSYAMYFNRKYGRTGALMQSSFKAILVDDNSYLMWLSAYIHQNPSVAGLGTLDEYEWSSYGDYMGRGQAARITDTKLILDIFQHDPGAYATFVADSHDSIKQQLEVKYLLLDD